MDQEDRDRLLPVDTFMVSEHGWVIVHDSEKKYLLALSPAAMIDLINAYSGWIQTQKEGE